MLLIAIGIGNNMGNRVLGQIASRGAGAATTPIPSPSALASDDAASHVLWKRRQVLSVATDPAFPDPRVTPEPPPPPPPATPRPSPKPSRTPFAAPPTAGDDASPDPNAYTSPPMPIPLITHSAGDTPPPDEESTPLPNRSSAPKSGTSPRPPGASPSPGVSTVNP